MLPDTNIPPDQLYLNDDELRAAMVEIAQHKIEGREAAMHWSNHLRLLAADTTSHQIEESEAEEEDLEPCTCVSYPSISLTKSKDN
jgi:hypothetical protein